MISVICVSNNVEILEKYLLKSLDDQNTNYELILIDNSNGKFKSAAEALNYGGKKANNKYLMFVHQDFQFNSDNWLMDSVELLNNLKDLGIAGVAGRHNRKTVSNIKIGKTSKFVGPIQINEPIRVQTLDECLFMIPKEIFKKIQFDENTCDNWHLYATDYCLMVKKEGYNVYVLPLGGYHASPGFSFTEDAYYATLKKLVEKHKKDFKCIYTTTGSWSTVYPLFLQIFYQRFYYLFSRIYMNYKTIFKH